MRRKRIPSGKIKPKQRLAALSQIRTLLGPYKHHDPVLGRCWATAVMATRSDDDGYGSLEAEISVNNQILAKILETSNAPGC